MATGSEVLRMLIPQGGWVIQGDSFEGVEFIEATPITESEFNAGFSQYDAWKAEQEIQMATDKSNATAKLQALGLTSDDLKALGL